MTTQHAQLEMVSKLYASPRQDYGMSLRIYHAYYASRYLS